MLYADTDQIQARRDVKQQQLRFFTLLIPFAVLVVIMLIMRLQVLCTLFAVLGAFFGIFTWDMFVRPARKYDRFLSEIRSGKSHETAGTLLPGEDAIVEEDGVRLRELVINIYADGSEEGERRFLLDARKPFPDAMIGRVVIVTSHDHFVLDVREREGKRDA